ncbi:unnamed protein product [Caenorhabditis auriculariae]|uniref:Uncharacterized protein n=1 Tax=Caenorhabditis auriculariae TaxID=2777116 RepID=A0A8S1HIU8_9PELO|nr:unnamed protein product [Caenorhabditis auriculariae]
MNSTEKAKKQQSVMAEIGLPSPGEAGEPNLDRPLGTEFRQQNEDRKDTPTFLAWVTLSRHAHYRMERRFWIAL